MLALSLATGAALGLLNWEASEKMRLLAVISLLGLGFVVVALPIHVGINIYYQLRLHALRHKQQAQTSQPEKPPCQP